MITKLINFRFVSLALTCCLLLASQALSAQFTETFETETVGSNTFSGGGATFTTVNPLNIATFPNGGSNGNGDNQFLEANGTGSVGEIQLTTAGLVFQLNSVDIYLSADAGTTTSDGQVTFRGTLAEGGSTLDAVINVTHPGSFNYATVSFAGTPLAGQNLSQVAVILEAGKNYIALDDFTFTALDPTQVNVTVNDVSMEEGDAGNTAFVFTITRSNNTTAFSVTANTADDTATAGSDYTAVVATVANFTMGGPLSQTVTVQVTGDLMSETSESFFLNLSAATNGAVLLDDQGVGTILDDDTNCETFEDEAAAGITSFVEGDITLMATGSLETGFFAGGGSTGSDYYLESAVAGVPYSGSVGKLMVTTANRGIELLRLDLWLSNDAEPNTSEIDMVRFIGTPARGGAAINVDVATTVSGGSWTQNIDFAGTAFAGVALLEVEVVLQGASNYVALDNICFLSVDNCVAPVINGVTVIECPDTPSGAFTLGVDGELNGAANWSFGIENEGLSCADQETAFPFTETISGLSFLSPNETYLIRASGGCVTDPVCFSFVPSEIFGISTLTLATTTYCQDAGVQTGLSGGSPAGGTYSGPGVTDDGNGMTFTFDPATAGAGTHTISYSIAGQCTLSSTATVQVVTPPTATFAPSPATFTLGSTIFTGNMGGSPVGGVYSGSGVTDDGNGQSYTFDPNVGGAGAQTITYTFTDGNGCAASATATVTVTAAALPGDICTDANDISALFAGPLNEAQVSAIQDNTGYNADNDPGAGYECWFGDAPVLNNTVWYTFTGDGQKYSIRSIACGADNPMINTDTQFALYSGDCAAPTAVACNDDEDFDNQVYNSYLEIVTEPGVDYLLMVDGYVAAADYDAIGTFCLQVTRLETVGVTNIDETDLRVFPNPTTGTIQLPQLALERVEVYDAAGRLVINQLLPGTHIDLAAQPAGFYVLKMYAGKAVYAAKVVKE